MTPLLPLHVRDEFPALQHAGCYLDSAATSLMPVPVLMAMDDYYCTYRASTHRGLYASAVRATEAYEEARATVARFIGASPDEVVLTAGATASANMLTYALEHTLDFAQGDVIVTTVMEHHATLIPLQELAHRNGFTLASVPHTGHALDYAFALSRMSKRTKLVSIVLASNVLGTLNEVNRIAKHAHELGSLVLVDATAAAGHVPLDVRALDCDFLYFSGHKMCGPTGIGVLYGKAEKLKQLTPGFFGGGIVEEVHETRATYTLPPHRFEPGTPNIGGAIGLGATIAYLEEIGLERIHSHVRALTAYAREKLGAVSGVTLYSAPPEENIGIVSFTLEGVHPHDVAQICADQGVAIRGGHHCAAPLHTALGIPATARASFYLYNTPGDVDVLVRAVLDAARLA